MRLLLLLLGTVFLLTGCGGERGLSYDAASSSAVLKFAEENFTLVDVVKSSAEPQDVSRIFLAEGSTIESVADQFLDGITMSPREISENTGEKQVIIYDNVFVTLTVDPENSANTLVEVASYGFVRDNYQPSFFNGLFVMWMLNDLLKVDDWDKKQRNRCLQAPGGCYGSYGSSGKGYKGPIGQPSLRGGSSSVRGGGPGTGK